MPKEQPNTKTLAPEIGKTYKLTYYGDADLRGRDIISEEFECLAKRRSGWYFYCHARGLDLTVKEHDFIRYLNNTVGGLTNPPATKK